MRKEPTDAERRLWWKLKARRLGGWKFKRQYPIGPYIVDFVCIEKKFVVELDGSQHEENAAYDGRRDAYLRERGFRVVRFWNAEFLLNQDGTADYILHLLEEAAPSPQPSPRLEERG
jgi:very-short-patch-repair endonuclease